MPWKINQSEGRCPASKPWGVVKESDGQLVGCHQTKSGAQDQLAALYANEPSESKAASMSEHVDPDSNVVEIDDREVSLREFGRTWDRIRVAHQANTHHPLIEVRVNNSGKPGSLYHIDGYASVTGWYELMPGIRESVDPSAFDRILQANPDVHALWDHDTRFVLARTKNQTLELDSNEHGLRYWAKVADTSYARDLRHLLERGDIDQASFAFTVADEGDEWRMREENDQVVIYRTIHEIGELFDVTITAKGANPFTDSSVARSAMRAALGERPRTFRGAHMRGAATDPPQPDQPGGHEGAASPRPTPGDDPAGVDPAVTDKAEHLRARIAERRSAVKGLRRRLKEIHE